MLNTRVTPRKLPVKMDLGLDRFWRWGYSSGQCGLREAQRWAIRRRPVEKLGTDLI
jgi:hypothetical protein